MLVITLHAFTSEVEVYTYKGRQFGKKKGEWSAILQMQSCLSKSFCLWLPWLNCLHGKI